MLHKILSDRRRSIGMSIDQLVEKSGVPKGTLTKVLTGVSPNPSLETVKAIAYALGLSLNDLEGVPVQVDVLYISKPSGDMKADEVRKFLHETIDQMSDDDLIFFKDFTLRMKK